MAPLAGVRTEGLSCARWCRCRSRTREQHGELGNRIAAMRGPLPVYVEDPVERLRIVSAAMQGLKVEASAWRGGARRAPGVRSPTLLAQASRLNFSTRLFNLIVTNVPGPQFPLYMLGRELREIVPMAFSPRITPPGSRDHELQRRRRLRAPRRLRRAARHREVRRIHRAVLDELLDVAEKSAPAARKPARGARLLAKRRREAVAQPQRLLARQNPSANLASSLARSGDHGGENTILG